MLKLVGSRIGSLKQEAIGRRCRLWDMSCGGNIVTVWNSYYRHVCIASIYYIADDGLLGFDALWNCRKMLKMEEVFSSETLPPTYKPAGRHNPDDQCGHVYRGENLDSHKLLGLLNFGTNSEFVD